MRLKTQEPTAESYKVMKLKDSLKLLPSSVSDSGICDCGLSASCCKICSTDVYKLVMTSSRWGKVHSDLKKTVLGLCIYLDMTDSSTAVSLVLNSK